MKSCCRCGISYPPTAEFFSRCAGLSDGLTSQCKVCRSAMWAAQYKKDRAKHIARANISTKKRREKPAVRESERIQSRDRKRQLLVDPQAREKHRKQVREWFTNNRERVKNLPSRSKATSAHHTARYHAQKLKATPPWADFAKIAEFYHKAFLLTKATGIEHHVDHKVPLRHKFASGLHVHHNLQVITASANRTKSNLFITEN